MWELLSGGTGKRPNMVRVTPTPVVKLKNSIRSRTVAPVFVTSPNLELTNVKTKSTIRPESGLVRVASVMFPSQPPNPSGPTGIGPVQFTLKRKTTTALTGLRRENGPKESSLSPPVALLFRPHVVYLRVSLRMGR